MAEGLYSDLIKKKLILVKRLLQDFAAEKAIVKEEVVEEKTNKDETPTDNETKVSEDEAAGAPDDVETVTEPDVETGATEDCPEETTNEDLNNLEPVEIEDNGEETQE